MQESSEGASASLLAHEGSFSSSPRGSAYASLGAPSSPTTSRSTSRYPPVPSSVRRVVGSGLLPLLGGRRSQQISEVREQYYCVICCENHAAADAFVLRRCGHRFCPSGLQGYVSTKVRDGQVYPTCFAESEVTASGPDTLSRNTVARTDTNGLGAARNMAVGDVCGAAIDEKDIETLLSLADDQETEQGRDAAMESGQPSLLDKYRRFKQQVDNPNTRTCQRCGQQDVGDPRSPAMVCSNSACGHAYCFEHGDAHPPSMSCAVYELNTRKENKLNQRYLDAETKPCPGCKRPIQKSGGCNAMKCSACGTGFCWLCGEEIGTDALPRHFSPSATGNQSKCAGKQFEGTEDEDVVVPEFNCVISLVLRLMFLALFFVLLPVCIALFVVLMGLNITVALVTTCFLRPLCLRAGCCTTVHAPGDHDDLERGGSGSVVSGGGALARQQAFDRRAAEAASAASSMATLLILAPVCIVLSPVYGPIFWYLDRAVAQARAARDRERECAQEEGQDGGFPDDSSDGGPICVGFRDSGSRVSLDSEHDRTPLISADNYDDPD